MVKVTREPDSVPYGDLEPCCVCFKPTSYWCTEKDVALCEGCAENITLAKVPSKTEWFRAILVKFPHLDTEWRV